MLVFHSMCPENGEGSLLLRLIRNKQPLFMQFWQQTESFACAGR